MSDTGATGHDGHRHRTDWLTDKELSDLKTEHMGCEIWTSGCVWCLLIEEVRQRRRGTPNA